MPSPSTCSKSKSALACHLPSLSTTAPCPPEAIGKNTLATSLPSVHPQYYLQPALELCGILKLCSTGHARLFSAVPLRLASSSPNPNRCNHAPIWQNKNTARGPDIRAPCMEKRAPLMIRDERRARRGNDAANRERERLSNFEEISSWLLLRFKCVMSIKCFLSRI